MNYLVLVPEEWIGVREEAKTGWNHFPSSYFLLTYPPDFLETPTHEISGFLINKIPDQLKIACWIFPKKFNKPQFQDYWPTIVSSNSSQLLINSVAFYDSWEETLTAFAAYENQKIGMEGTSVFCQYEAPYTYLLGLWEEAGATSFHPGDYDKEEILDALGTMKGNWIYFGHGAWDRLRGYGHLEASDLRSVMPSTPLGLTAWLTCSTMEQGHDEMIAWDWYRKGGAFAMMASGLKVKTEENQLLGKGILRLLTEGERTTIGAMLLNLIQADSNCFSSILSQYYLLGFPWVEMKI